MATTVCSKPEFLASKIDGDVFFFPGASHFLCFHRGRAQILANNSRVPR